MRAERAGIESRFFLGVLEKARGGARFEDSRVASNRFSVTLNRFRGVCRLARLE